jgi:hypothetical protein
MGAGIISAVALLAMSDVCISSVNAGEARDKATMKVVPFSISDVKLLEGPFKHAESD